MLPVQEFQRFIVENGLFGPDDKVLLAVSGGRDSVLMAHLFKAAGYGFGIAHCNFNLRGEESMRDEHFVKMLASTLDVPVYIRHFDTKAYAHEHQVSTQMAARALRYDWFEQLRAEEGYQLTALAQHQDDAMETVLLNLTRGTGISGLHGILPKRGKLIRPLLFLSRSEIEKLVDTLQIDFVEDSSNLSTNYVRNKIRLKVIPLLREINPALSITFQENIQRFSDTEQVLQQVVASHRERLFRNIAGHLHLSVSELKLLHPMRLLLFELLKPYGFQEGVIADLSDALAADHPRVGASFFSRSHQLTIDREDVILTTWSDGAGLGGHQLLHVTDSAMNFRGQELRVSHHLVSDFIGGVRFDGNKDKAYVDTDKLIFPLVVRSWQEGDRFRPLGMRGFKNLSDLFIDEKVPLALKPEVPVVLNGNGDVIWVAGLRQDDRYRLLENTKKVSVFGCADLQFTISKQS